MKTSGHRFQEILRDRQAQKGPLSRVDFLHKLAGSVRAACLSHLSRARLPIVMEHVDVDSVGIEMVFRSPKLRPGRGLEWIVRLGDKSGEVILRTEEFAGDLCGKLGGFLENPPQQFLREWRGLMERDKGFFSRLNGVNLSVPHLPEAATGVVMEGGLHRVEFGFTRNWLGTRTDDVAAWVGEHTRKLIPIWEIVHPFALGDLPLSAELDEGAGYPEGREKYAQHLKRERDPRVILEAKQKFMSKHGGKLFCEICAFDFSTAYGTRGLGYIEGHHRRPVSKMKPGDVTKAVDIAMVCSNCHRILHRSPFMTPEELRSLMGTNSGSGAGVLRQS